MVQALFQNFVRYSLLIQLSLCSFQSAFCALHEDNTTAGSNYYAEFSTRLSTNFTKVLGYKELPTLDDLIQKGSLGGYLHSKSHHFLDKAFTSAAEKTGSLVVNALIGKWIEPTITYLQFGFFTPTLYKIAKTHPTPRGAKIHFDDETQELLDAYKRQFKNHSYKNIPLPNLMITGARGVGKSALAQQLNTLSGVIVKTYTAENLARSSDKELKHFLRFIKKPRQKTVSEIFNDVKSIATLKPLAVKKRHIIIIEEAEKIFGSHLKGEQAQPLQTFRLAMQNQTPYASFVITTHCPTKIDEETLDLFQRKVEIPEPTQDIKVKILLEAIREHQDIYCEKKLQDIASHQDIGAMISKLSRQDIVNLTAVIDTNQLSVQSICKILDIHIHQLLKIRKQILAEKNKKKSIKKQSIEDFYQHYIYKKTKEKKELFDSYVKSGEI
ncbi:MAG: AAA family ATPase [Oligoflexales bacterium]